MDWRDFFSAFALFLVFEGIIPFMNPHQWRSFMKTALNQSDSTLRAMGLSSMIIGLVVLFATRG